MSFNIWVDGKQGGVPATAEVILASKADIVGLQEVQASGKELARLTNMTYIQQRKGGVLTRYPVISESPNKLGFQLEISPGKRVWFFNVHLYHAPYQPYQLADIPYGDGNPFIRTAAEAIAEAIRARGAETATLLMDMAPAIRAKEPIILTGEFNEPSHLDWTEEVRDAGKVPIAVVWPQSRMLLDSGLSDAYRVLFPSPLLKPGHTWTPRPSSHEIHDRIDFVYSMGVTPVEAKIIGESSEKADIVVSPYPSDHRAVMIEFSVE